MAPNTHQTVLNADIDPGKGQIPVRKTESLTAQRVTT
jgi:hypothetical protein